MAVVYIPIGRPPLSTSRIHCGSGVHRKNDCFAFTVVDTERPTRPSKPTGAGPALKFDRLARPVRQQVPANGTHLAQGLKLKQTPQQLARYIKAQWQFAVQAAAHKDFARVTAYLIDMSRLCHQSNHDLDHMHLNALLHGTAKVWLTAMDNCHQEAVQEQLRQHLLTFLGRAATHLLRVLPEVDARGVSSIFWSFAKMQVNSDTLVSGTVDGLAQQFIRDIDTATDQSHATLLLACVHLKINPCKGALLQAVLQQLDTMDMTQFSSRHLANIVYSMAKLPSAQPTAQLLDDLCKGFLAQMHQPGTRHQPNAQDIANFAWALSELRHVPSESLTSAMVSSMLSLCFGFGKQQPSAQGTSNFLYGLANLRLPVRPQDAVTLAMHLLETGSRYKQHNQHLSNTAWSLAALRCLSMQTFCQLLQGMQQPVDHVHLRQLYRALHWLQPHGIRDPQQQEAWSQLQANLHSLGPPPPMERLPLLGNKALAALLEGLGVQYSLALPIKGCWVDAMVQPSSNWARPALIVFEVDTRCTNAPSRLTGCAALRYELLSREGALILIPPHLAQATLEQLAHYVRPRLVFAAAGNLDVYLK